MGSLRFLLALAVVFAHVGIGGMVGGAFAVQLFFMVSGYLMSFVLFEARSYTRLRDFYFNRALRIFPIYFLVAVTSLAAQFVAAAFGTSNLFETYADMPPIAAFFVGISNFTLLGQDQVMFMAVKDSTLIWNGDFLNSDVLLYNGLLVPQAWSLGIELTFYIVAPFVLRSKRRIMFIFLLSLSLRALFALLGFGFSDPWSYRFFPTELAVFLLGAISHQFIAPKIFTIGNEIRQRFTPIVVFSTVAVVVLFGSVPLPTYVKGLLLFVFIAAALPLLFEYQGRHKVDNFLGQLSYPIYIWHILVISVVTALLPLLGLQTSLLVPFVLVGTVAISWASLRLIDDPVQNLRSKYRFR